MAAMINLPTKVADPTLAAELLRRRWQEKPAYFSPLTVKPMPNPKVWRPSNTGAVFDAGEWRNLSGRELSQTASLRRAAKDARQTARMHGASIYVWKDGKIVALKP